MAALEEKTLSNRNKLLVKSFTKKMERMMNSKMDAFREELQQEQNRARKRREPEINPKPPDDTWRSTWHSPHKTSHAPKSEFCFYSDFQQTNEFQLYKFSGKANYLEWERNMDNWLYYHRILRKERLAFAISQLTGDAYKWWLQEVDDRWYCKEQTITTWEVLKELLRNKYAPQESKRASQTNPKVQGSAVQEKKPALVPDQKKTPIPMETKTQPDPVEKLPKKVPKLVISEKMEAKSTSQPEKATELVVVHKQSLNPSLESSGEPKQCKSSYLSKSKEVTCYNCRKKGHLAATCLGKHELNNTSLGSKLNSPNSSSEVVNQGLENFSSCVMHLFLSKDVDSGHIMEYKDDKVKENVETQPHAAVQDQQQLTSKEEQTKDETVNHLSFLRESLEANCDIPFFQSDLMSEKNC